MGHWLGPWGWGWGGDRVMLIDFQIFFMDFPSSISFAMDFHRFAWILHQL